MSLNCSVFCIKNDPVAVFNRLKNGDDYSFTLVGSDDAWLSIEVKTSDATMIISRLDSDTAVGEFDDLVESTLLFAESAPCNNQTNQTQLLDALNRCTQILGVTVDPDFEAPSSWRGNIALDITTEGGYELTLEYNKDTTEKGVFYRELGMELESYLADGRGVYSHGPGDYLLTNTDLGGAEAWSASVRKSFDNGLSFFASWAAVDAKDVYALTSSQAESSYGYTQRWDGENVPEARSSFMTSRKIIAGLEYRTMLFGDNETRISAIYVRKSGEPYSITFDDPRYSPAGGVGYSRFYEDYSLPYVPTGADDPNVVFTSATAAAEVMDHINNGPLAQYKGTYAPRNAFTTPGYSRLDIRLTQEIPGPMDGHKVIFYLDLLNALNMLDDDDGHVYEYSYNNSRQILSDGTDDQGRFIIRGVDPDDSYFIRDNSGQSRWQIQMGLKYQF